jgi:hypothetical protein
MFEKRRSRGVLHTRMRQVEEELFRAEYSGEINPDRWQEHSRLSRRDQRHRGEGLGEQMAKGQGYDRVVWDEMPAGAAG